MAIVIASPKNKSFGDCEHCGPRRTVADSAGPDTLPAFDYVGDGYIADVKADDSGLYTIMARCFYCNHRDRG